MLINKQTCFRDFFVFERCHVSTEKMFRGSLTTFSQSQKVSACVSLLGGIPSKILQQICIACFTAFAKRSEQNSHQPVAVSKTRFEDAATSAFTPMAHAAYNTNVYSWLVTTCVCVLLSKKTTTKKADASCLAGTKCDGRQRNCA